ncbi:glycosyltransferase [Mumia sp. zg.B53]|uniref:glycosyltransferase n=1 Tax=Mumia sp. zg.B53 TaxID=2855449 RepID=UPI001C6ECF9B|nr:glycosyltransferase [Mumia sp. zg.B53]MBW9214103.1 glycosyltransferase [Mumia sp. zg.B53]
MTQHDVRHQPTVSVIVPSYLGADVLPISLGSLARQTLDPRAFEVVVVLNGPEDESRRVIDDIRTASPALRLRIVSTSTPGAGNARNLGLDAAAGRFVTFVDADDEVTPGYLKVLIDHAEPGVVPVASVADVTDERAAPSFENYLSNRLVARAGEVADPTTIPSSLGFVAGKLTPTAVARAGRFDTSLRSGEDVLYWFDVFEATPFRIKPVALDADGVYLRHIVANSVSRQASSYDFSVTQRLDVVERLWSRQALDPRSRKLRSSFTAGQVSHVNAYLRLDPADHPKVLADIRARGLEDAIPWRRLNDGLARDLAILYSFLPYADTSALVAARRIRDRGIVVDVVSNTMGADKPIDWAAGVIAREQLDQTFEVDARTAAFEWGPLKAFTRRALAKVAEWEKEKGLYRSVYSRTMWPGSNLVAAVLKLRRPDLRWIAEFSDPQLFNAYGQRRVGRAKEDGLWRELTDGLAAAGIDAPADRNIPHLVELLAYALADEIVFTNEHQRSFMLGYLPEQQLVERVLERSVVSHHPTLPKSFYHRVEGEYEIEPDVLNIAYFGAFYATRGLTEVVDALKALEPNERAMVRLHVFTGDPETLAKELAVHGLTDIVVANPYVSYFAFLELTTRMDVLLVNDAKTRDHYDVNPFLPSKWSDYAGSGSDVWAVVEEGSILSTMPTTYRSPLGDAAAAVAEVRRMLADRGLGREETNPQ